MPHPRCAGSRGDIEQVQFLDAALDVDAARRDTGDADDLVIARGVVALVVGLLRLELLA